MAMNTFFVTDNMAQYVKHMTIKINLRFDESILSRHDSQIGVCSYESANLHQAVASCFSHIKHGLSILTGEPLSAVSILLTEASGISRTCPKNSGVCLTLKCQLSQNG